MGSQVKLDELLSQTALASELTNGYVRQQVHPTLPYAILNYTKKAQTESHWTEVTELTRGLIYDLTTNEIVARPFRKFFNYGEPGAPLISGDVQVQAFDKVDGSLGILYPDPSQRHGYAVATRGSFTSEQAVWATNWLNEQEEFPWALRPFLREEWTCLVEIVYPDNRIVVDYGEFAGLVYLGEIAIPTGSFYFRPEDWRGTSTDMIYEGSFDGVFDLPERQNAEGYVLYVPEIDDRLKVKYDEYKRVHRLVFGLTVKSVLDMLRTDGLMYLEFVKQLPEEHADWVAETASYLTNTYITLWHEYYEVWMDVYRRQYAGELLDRKAVAMHIASQPKWIKSCVFSSLDGKNYSDVIWKQVELRLRTEGQL